MDKRNYNENLIKLSEDYKALIIVLKQNPSPTIQNWKLGDGFTNVCSAFVSYHNKDKTEKLMVFKIWNVFYKKLNQFVTNMSRTCH